ncbi:flavin reductase family protein [Chitinophaga tropicalis]|uniref:Flavin reductase family protein n=1 Tax=Chitinophaga tropicalis TaxID=2683588 RepID=A0A7K1U7A4_9BACT|nr:flavin reductase family protein [Chitinophaga tropicalis]MVT10220.1 flavin reductase family protein [Chitinophaga tropicalis]
MHVQSQPPILYFGTPVALLSTINENGSYNIAPMSSVFWLGWRCMLGLSAFSKTTENILRTKECVLNLPSFNLAPAVNRLAKTTGSNPVPAGKLQKGYRYEPDKFGTAGLTPLAGNTVAAPRILECPVQLEAVLTGIHPLAEDNEAQRGRIITLEMRIQRVYIDENILMPGMPDKVDPDKWRPLIMSFQEFYGLGEKVHTSTLAEIPEVLYKTSDMEQAATLNF